MNNERIQPPRGNEMKASGYLLGRYPEFFLTPEKEAQFCAEHDITILRLPNGIDVVAASYRHETAMDADINFYFPRGAFFDPPGKSGLAHMTEHLTAYRHLQYADENLAYFNASTSPSEVSYNISGPANSDYMDVGVWPTCREFLHDVHHPENVPTAFTNGVNTERLTVMSEVVRAQASHERRVHSEILSAFVADNNPVLTYVLGSEEDLATITDSDIARSTTRLFEPNGLFVSILTHEDTRPIRQELTNFLLPLLESIPQKSYGTHDVVSDHYYDRMRHGPTPEHIMIDTGISNNTVTIVYAWRTDFGPISKEVSALEEFSFLANTAIFQHTRERGISYVSSADSMRISLQSGLFTLRFDIASDGLTEELLDGHARSLDILGRINADDINRLIARREKTRAINADERNSLLHDVFWGMKEVGRIYDGKKSRGYTTPQPADIAAWRDHFIQTPPVVLAIGDLAHT